MEPKFFKGSKEFRKWLITNHMKVKELLVGFYKVHTGKPSMTWSESVDHALCFGWIDGVRRTINAESYSIRFTPRRPDSIWSAVNIQKMQALSKAGLMTEAGEKAFEKRTENKSEIYSHEKEPVQLAPVYESQFKKNKAAWMYFKAQAPSYQKVITHWIMSAKQEKTKSSRLEKTIKVSAEGKRVL
jgi:uncharacterized protein YdeI (YjbR/CyaY-like superfamily)